MYKKLFNRGSIFTSVKKRSASQCTQLGLCTSSFTTIKGKLAIKCQIKHMCDRPEESRDPSHCHRKSAPSFPVTLRLQSYSGCKMGKPAMVSSFRPTFNIKVDLDWLSWPRYPAVIQLLGSVLLRLADVPGSSRIVGRELARTAGLLRLQPVCQLQVG